MLLIHTCDKHSLDCCEQRSLGGALYHGTSHHISMCLKRYGGRLIINKASVGSRVLKNAIQSLDYNCSSVMSVNNLIFN